MNITPTEFQFFTDFLKKTSGYYLTDEKQYLLETRLEEAMKVLKIEHVPTLIRQLQQDKTGKEAVCVIEAMTVNETFFFRDNTPFEIFEQQVLPQLADLAKGRRIRIWSAACSTGQEPYSIAMIMEENKAKYPNLVYEITASDINNRVLAKARQGVYSELEVNRGLPEKYRTAYFERDGSAWKVKEEVRRQVSFRQLNLRDKYDLTGPFDFVLLRNVLIYFDKPDKEDILNKISRLMRTDGFLMLGAAEGIYDPKHYFQRCAEVKGLYRYAGPAASANASARPSTLTARG